MANAATGVANATGIILNSGSILIEGNALAQQGVPGAGGTATANVNLSWFIDQEVTATGVTAFALASIVNDGVLIGLAKTATAIASAARS